MRIGTALFIINYRLGVEAKRGYEGLEKLCNPNRLGDDKPVALVHCPLGSIENKYRCDWTAKKMAESIKKVHATRGFLQLEHAGDDGTGPKPSSSRY